jgi:enoyl-CoA hydratase/3-hydroxyacyl-CoA dehydrogenase
VTLQNPLAGAGAHRLPERVAVVGAGTIGPDIAYYLKSALPGLSLALVDIRQEALDKAVARLGAMAQKGVARGKLTEAQARTVTDGLTSSTEYAALAGCDWVIEAATENLDLKRRIFAQVEEVVRPDALITSNTSSLPASRIFSKLAIKGRATVTHFFAPAYQNPAVEVIRWEHGSEQTIEYLRWLFASTGKVPFVTADAICFMLDRVFDNWCNEAAYLLDRATAAEIDAVAQRFVHAGPFQVLNLAHGNPIILETNTLQMEEGEHYRPAAIFRSVETWKTLAPGQSAAEAATAAEKRGPIADRLLGVLFSQSVDILDRQIGESADLDLGCTQALGFKRGPLELMAELGEAEVRRVLDRFKAERPGMPMPQRAIASYSTFRRHVLVDDLDGGVKLLTIRRPQAMNALDDRVTDELLSAIREHEANPAVAGFVITGYGPRAFCAGADIGRFPEVLGRAQEAAQYARDCSRLLVHLDQMKKPVVAALNGMALGGGLELALRCHGIVAVRSAWMQFPEITLGIAPGLGGMVVPYRRWSQAAGVFHDMLRLAKKLSANEARDLGVVEALARDYRELLQLACARVHELCDALPRAADGAVRIAPPPSVEAAISGRPLSAEVVGIIEAAIRDAAAVPGLTEALEVGYLAFAKSACSAAAREGITAFNAKRRPDFKTTG